jgi:2-phospho-L-lactate guanylyltransferase
MIAQKLVPPQTEEDSTAFVIVPVKKLSEAKSRLSPLLSENERKQFCLEMLEDVLTAIRTTKGIFKTIVMSKDPQILQVAKNFHIFPFKESRSGLNQAISEAINWCISLNAKTTLILPADIPLVSSEDVSKILAFGRTSSMVISPSRWGNGTNALLLNPPRAVPAFYGRDSFQRYIEEASKRGIPFHVYRSPRIAFDVDTTEDLADYVALNNAETHANRFLKEIGVLKRLESYRKR